jgi:hypothetical protein
VLSQGRSSIYAEKATIVRINEFEPLAKNKKQEPKSRLKAAENKSSQQLLQDLLSH